MPHSAPLCILVLLACPPGLQQAAAQAWQLVVPPGRGSFEESWRPGSWPMGVQPLVGPAGRLHMMGSAMAWESRNGVDWEVSHRASGRGVHGRSAALHGDRIWQLGGQRDDRYLSEVSSSIDGREWVLGTDAPWSGRRGAAVVSFRGSLWVIGGVGEVPRNDIWHTGNGTQWERLLERAPWPAESQPVVVVYRDSLWAFGGSAWESTTADLWVSGNGREWARVIREAPWGPRVYAGIVAFDDRLWVLGGVTPGGERLNDVWSSTDGRNWSHASAPWTRRAGNRTVVFRGALWLFGGKGKEEDEQSGYASDIWRLERRAVPLR